VIISKRTLPRRTFLRGAGACVALPLLDAASIEALFRARGSGVDEVVAAADALRARVSGDVVRYVVNRNINYTNVCAYSCRFCAFSKGRAHEQLRGPAYDLALDEVARRVGEARERGANAVCMQGGIHPHYTGEN
jgi:FO synthase